LHALLRCQFSAGEGRCSFLKKRTKKLLTVSGRTEFTRFGSVRREICTSFLLLFFKKGSPFLSYCYPRETTSNRPRCLRGG
jgi:hypothetical protein